MSSILQAGIRGYLAETYAMDKIAAAASDIVYNRSPSYGTFSTEMNVSFLFGMPRNVFFSGVVMDVDQISSNTESVDNCYADWVAFNRSSGMRSSAYGHLIPERLFSTEENPVEGVSTAKALALAMAQGQRVYTLTNTASVRVKFVFSPYPDTRSGSAITDSARRLVFGVASPHRVCDAGR